jgi:hypothetical protein
MGMRNFIHSKAVDEEITYPVISVSGELGSSPPTKCCSQEESTPLLPLPPQYVQKWIMEKKERQKDDTI